MEKRSRLNIAFDLDGVLVDTNLVALGYLEDRNGGKKIIPRQYEFATDYNIPSHTIHNAYVEAFRFLSAYNVMPGAKRLVSALWELTGDDITIITSRHSDYASDTFRICEQICGPIPFRVAMVGQNGKKIYHLKNFTYFVEDRRATAKTLAENDKIVFLVNTTYNQGIQHENIYRIDNLMDIFSYDLNIFVE